MLWSSFVNPKKVRILLSGSRAITDIQAADRMSMKMSELVEHVSKKPIPPWTRNLLVEVMVCDEEDEDVEVSQFFLQ